MTEHEIEILLHNLVEEKFNAAMNKLITFHKCKQIYNEMCALGYCEPMQAFKNVVIYTLILNPEMTEDEFLVEFYNKMNK